MFGSGKIELTYTLFHALELGGATYLPEGHMPRQGLPAQALWGAEHRGGFLNR